MQGTTKGEAPKVFQAFNDGLQDPGFVLDAATPCGEGDVFPSFHLFLELELIEKLVDPLFNIFEPGGVYLLPDFEDFWESFHGRSCRTIEFGT